MSAKLLEVDEVSVAFRGLRGATEVLGWLLGFEAEIWLERGDLSRAARMARESMEIAERIESPLSRGITAWTLSRVFAQEGDLDAAVALAEQGIQDAASTNRSYLPSAMSVLAGFRCARGGRDEGRRLALEALHLAETEGFRYGQLAAELVLARIALLDALPDDASAWLARAEQTLDVTAQRRYLPELLELCAGLAQLRGDVPGRERALREAQRLHREMGASGQVERIARELSA